MGPEVWRRRHEYAWRGVDYDQRERWFMARVDAFSPSTRGLTAEEEVDLREWRWWSAAELTAAEDRLVPQELAALYAGLLRDGPPGEVVDVGV